METEIEKSVEEGNVEIAKFMGWEYVEKSDHPYLLPLGFWEDKEGIGHKNLLYHSSWDWLHPVLTKIKEVNSTLDADEVRFILFELSVLDEISDVWLAALQFIKWYNIYKTNIVEDFKKHGLP